MTTDRFETTFSIAASPDVVWKRLDQRDGEGHWLLPAFEGLGEEIDVEPGSRLHVRKVTEPCAGSEIVIVLEHEASGTKVTVSQSGFPAWFASATDALRDRLASHRRRPRALPRPWSARRPPSAVAWATLGCSFRETTGGLEVIETMPGTLADKIGLVAGDVVLTVGGAPIVTRAELETMMRVSGGQEVEVEWAHGDEKLAATGTL